MTNEQEPKSGNGRQSPNRRGRGYLIVFYILFSAFFLNVVLGKAQVQFGWDMPFLLADVPEFLLLFTAAIFLMLAALAREKGNSSSS